MGGVVLRNSEGATELRRGRPPSRSALSGHPEVPDDPRDRQRGAHVYQEDVDGHHPDPDGPVNSSVWRGSRGLKLLRRLALVTTVTELNAMAAPA